MTIVIIIKLTCYIISMQKHSSSVSRYYDIIKESQVSPITSADESVY